ncbi:betaine/proline/choline family ABC transporter ATP-binding protein [Bacillus velezensis]|uniref:betaine/proline/choline family ABC transporter ATP-binding protein n=1 Tax=Bacillus velezensis TaxID=492670 RepID=UPI0013DFCE83|nr:betaine/proline/choline family ABC transporter ATP-binding protein [Bacillus velezensis]MEC1926787.1 betaine/proline/choline family ABC transporter ATP-binding protein [Bacillus velezensis]NGM58851.1 betaine/proline/choline family ABC transporter ATP-binding protein [Bacillus velezensis]QVL38966.1 betaine/proline/choline family ABC transporter ATP-binding protein [Bacillus velezensis]UYQ97744.1 betaine/proline/choline family ABC transporter ATP-binding protein [Bacillus velezensis]WDV41594.
MLTLENVSKTYKGGKKAVNSINLNIDKGEFICFIGPSGCGKTTTMKMINRLIEPTEGRILIEGRNIMEQDPVELRRSIGYVIQQIGLFPHMTIQQNITLVPKLLKHSAEKRKERARELLKLVDMGPEYLDRYPHELSGGQQQRIGVLRALAAEPPLILMDEPFGALDPITRDSLQEEFKKLQKTLHKTIVFVTHDMDEAIKLADRIVILKAGEIVQAGTPDEILRFPANEFVEEFIGKERLIQSSSPDIERVEQIMNPDPVTVTPEKTLSAAIQLMHAERVDSLLVIDEKNVLQGYVDVEMIDRKRRQAVTVAEVLERDLYTVRSGTLLRDAVHKILKRGVKFVPVIDEDGRLTGIVTRASLVDIVYDSIWGEENQLAVMS